MFGFTIIKKKELKRLRNVDELFNSKIIEKEDTINNLKYQVDQFKIINEQLTRKRNYKGRFIKNNK